MNLISIESSVREINKWFQPDFCKTISKCFKELYFSYLFKDQIFQKFNTLWGSTRTISSAAFRAPSSFYKGSNSMYIVYGDVDQEGIGKKTKLIYFCRITENWWAYYQGFCYIIRMVYIPGHTTDNTGY